MPDNTTLLHQPTPRDLIQLDRPGGVRVSPDGKRVAFQIRRTNWKENRYENHLQLWEAGEDAHRLPNRWLTRSGHAQQMEWLDERTLAVLRSGPEEDQKAQIWLFEGCTGEGWQVTEQKTGVEWFYPFANGFLYKARNPERDEQKERTEKYGKFVHYEQELSASALYYTDLDEMRSYHEKVRLGAEDEVKDLIRPAVELSRLLPEALSIQEIVPSPKNEAIYFTCRRRDDLVYLRDVRAFCLQLDPARALQEDLVRQKAEKSKPKPENGDPKGQKEQDLTHLGRLVSLYLPRASNFAAIAPDGETLLISHQGRDDKFYTQSELWSIPVEAALNAPDPVAFREQMRCLTAGLDNDIFSVYWVGRGIFASYVKSTGFYVAQIDEQGGYQTIDLGSVYPMVEIHAARDGSLGFVGANASSFPEVYLASPVEDGLGWEVTPVSDIGVAVRDWQFGTVETIRWKSRDGTEVEGVLYKPVDFDPAKKYPLAFVVHGGPRWVSPEFLIGNEDMAYYPTVQLVNQGVVVLKPNYRGSIGRGQAFTELNVNNLGVGDLWDLESGIDYLVELGLVDLERVGCMGWSQGGYISAYAGLHSQRFKAVSVGAGISDWYTYHISNDIPDFTTDYLSSSPFRNRELYEKTAPIRNLANASTPMIIQHGSDDRRVPLSNANELYRGLKEMGVPVELFIYPGMGHPITKPRQNHAVMEQNLAWFEHYLLGKELALPG
jgi:dipeptidyl aminopeptidase/acylaminoacyl peptidase